MAVIRDHGQKANGHNDHNNNSDSWFAHVSTQLKTLGATCVLKDEGSIRVRCVVCGTLYAND